MKIVLLERNSVGQDVDVSCFEELGDVTAYGNTTMEDAVKQRIRDITPHLAWASVEARQRCVREVYLDIAAFLHGGIRNAVNL